MMPSLGRRAAHASASDSAAARARYSQLEAGPNEARTRWERLCQIRREKFDYILPRRAGERIDVDVAGRRGTTTRLGVLGADMWAASATISSATARRRIDVPR